ncbi:MAG: hypothetical protein QM754_14735 [Tepidisphaeraceae bacterium]
MKFVEVTVSQVLEDLPDPLDPPPPVPAASTDDLLAKMADEAIDRLLASADKGNTADLPTPAVQPFSATAVAAIEIPVDDVSLSESAGGGLTEADLASAIDDVLPFTDVEESPPVAVPPPEELAAVATVVETPPVAAAVATPAADIAPPAPAEDVKALLHEEAAAPKPSLLLLPLRLLNLPFAWLGERGRTFAGLLGIVTLVPAACAIVYVLFLRGK